MIKLPPYRGEFYDIYTEGKAGKIKEQEVGLSDGTVVLLIHEPQP